MLYTEIFQVEEDCPFFLEGEQHTYKISGLSEGYQELLYQTEFGGWGTVPPNFVLSAIRGAPGNVTLVSVLDEESRNELQSILDRGYRYLTRGYFGEIRGYDKHPRDWTSCPNVADTVHVIQLDHLSGSPVSSLISSRGYEPLDLENLLKREDTE